MKIILSILIILALVSCNDKSPPQRQRVEIMQDLPTRDTITIIPSPSGLQLFIDSMSAAHFVIDTNRMKEIMAWREMENSPKEMMDGHVIMRFPFPVKNETMHFSDPRTYFFAKWNTETSTFRNGDDFLLMTWQIDSIGISREKEIYRSFFNYMGNFPCYCFRDKDRVYALAHRESVKADRTRELATRLRDYVNPMSKVFGATSL